MSDSSEPIGTCAVCKKVVRVGQGFIRRMEAADPDWVIVHPKCYRGSEHLESLASVAPSTSSGASASPKTSRTAPARRVR